MPTAASRSHRANHLESRFQLWIAILQLILWLITFFTGEWRSWTWLALPILVLVFCVTAPWAAFRRAREWDATLPKSALVASAVLAAASLALVISSRLTGNTALDFALAPVVVGQFALVLEADHRARGGGSPRFRQEARLRLAIITLSAVIGIGSEALILAGAAAAGPNDTHAPEKKTTAESSSAEIVPSTTATGKGESSPDPTATPSTGPLTADDYCGYAVADRLEAASSVDVRELFRALIERGADWAGCPSATPVRMGELEVWMLEHPVSDKPAGILIAGSRCAPVVIAPDIADRALALLRSGELLCAAAWTVNEPSRVQVFETAKSCIVLLQRDVQSEYREVPGAVAEVAASLGRRHRARPFIQSVAKKGNETIYFVAFDAPGRGLFNMYPVEVTLDLRTGDAYARSGTLDQVVTSDGTACPSAARVVNI